MKVVAAPVVLSVRASRNDALLRRCLRGQPTSLRRIGEEPSMTMTTKTKATTTTTTTRRNFAATLSSSLSSSSLSSSSFCIHDADATTATSRQRHYVGTGTGAIRPLSTSGPERTFSSPVYKRRWFRDKPALTLTTVSSAPRRSKSYAASSPISIDRSESCDYAVSAPPGTITIPFILADIGEGIAEVELLDWLVTTGDLIDEFQDVCRVESDKSATEISSRYQGVVVGLCGARGDMIKVGSPLMHIAVEAGRYGTAADAYSDSGSEPDPAAGMIGVSAPPLPSSSVRPLHTNITDISHHNSAVTKSGSASGSTSSANNNIVPFLLADIGEGIVEVELLQWHVQPGDAVRQFQVVCDVQSDKATIDITSRYDGIVTELCGSKGDVIRVGSPLMMIETETPRGGGGGGGGGEGIGVGGGSDAVETAAGGGGRTSSTLHNVDDVADRLHIPSVEPKRYPSAASADDAAADTASSFSTKVMTSPAVRKLGKDHGIDLTSMSGSGPKGRILKADVLKVVRGRATPATAAPSSTTTTSFPMAAESLSAAQKAEQGDANARNDTVVPLRGYARSMVKTMTSSLQVPHMVFADKVDAGRLLEARSILKPAAEAMGVPKLTVLPFMIKAASLAISEFPTLNASLDVEGGTVTYHGDHDIGVAMDTPRGLAVPVVRKCQELSVLDIARELNRLQALAVEGNLCETDISSPTFSFSNIGTIGGTYMSPVIVPPQSAIGAVGKIQREPHFVRNDSMEVTERHVMNVSWAGDHRLIDGATIARFSNAWKRYVESPVSMTLVMK